MASTRIPIELFSYILAYGRDEHDLIRDYEDREARQRTLHHLSSLSSVCVYWANFIRPRIFQILVLRSAQDLYGLLALLRMPCSPRLLSIAHYLRTVAVFYRFTDYLWCHNLQRLQASGARKELGLCIHISGPAPCVRNNLKERTARHPLYNTVPRIVPIHRSLLLQVDLIIENVKFPDGAGLVNLIRDISYSGILPRSIYCARVGWDDKLTLPFASLDPTFALNQNPHVKPSDVTIKHCTDNFLVAFATHSYIGRDVSMLSPSDANQLLGLFCEWASLTGKALSTMKDFTIISQAIHDIPVSGRKNLLFKAAQGPTGYLWRLQTRERLSRLNPITRMTQVVTELRFCTRPHQGHGLGSSQTAHIRSITIGLYLQIFLRQVEWRTILLKALGFPMLDTIKVCIQGWDEVGDFVQRHRKILAIAESLGKLRLYFSDMPLRMPFKDKHWRQQDFSDVLDAIDKSDSEKEFENESESLQEDLPAESLQSDAVIESERVLNKETSHLLSSGL